MLSGTRDGTSDLLPIQVWQLTHHFQRLELQNTNLTILTINKQQILIIVL